MSAPVVFLQALARAATALTLYAPDHPSARRAIDQAFDALPRRQGAPSTARITILGDEVLWGTTPLRALRGWAWATRLGSMGIQRVEIDDQLRRVEFWAFVQELADRLTAAANDEACEPFTARAHVRVGGVVVGAEPSDTLSPAEHVASDICLIEEIASIEWLFTEIAAQGLVPLVESQAIVSALAIVMHVDGRLVLPLARPARTRGSLAAHSLNVAVLSMGLAEALGCSSRDARTIGVAGLLHDAGKALMLPGRLGADASSARGSHDTHPVEGARVILRSDARLGLAAVVAYEHHLLPDGRGYPPLQIKRDCHWATRLVQVCNVYDHLRWLSTHDAMSTSVSVLDELKNQTGTVLDPSMVHTFARMVGHTEPRTAAPGRDAAA